MGLILRIIGIISIAIAIFALFGDLFWAASLFFLIGVGFIAGSNPLLEERLRKKDLKNRVKKAKNELEELEVQKLEKEVHKKKSEK